MSTTDEDRETAFQRYLETTENYFAKWREVGRPVWFDSSPDPVAARRELYMRRWVRPEPPTSVPEKTMSQIRGME